MHVKVAIEALGIHYVGGGRTATINLLEALFALDTQNEYLVVLSQPEPSLVAPAGNVRQWIAPLKNRFLLRIWAQVFLPTGLQGYDVVHFAKNLGVFGIRSPTVVTIYDLTTLLYPDLFPAFDVWYWRHIQIRTLRAADRIIAISETTARELLSFYPIPPERVRVIYPACAPHFRPAAEKEILRVRQRYGLPEQFILHVGRIDRKKNLAMLVEAFAQLRKQTHFPGKLVLVGEEYPKSRDLHLYSVIEHLELQQNVAFTGRVPDFDLPALYSAATAAVVTSVHEGFGLAALEALACGAPLVVSQAGAVTEAVGDAALIVSESPGADSFAEVLLRLVQDPELLEELRHRGIKRAQEFRPENMALQTLRLYEEVVSAAKASG
jgi:glycosyltransferase involved in cell wall biosynthesis